MHIKETTIQDKAKSDHNILRAENIDNKIFIETLIAKHIITGEEFMSLIQLLKAGAAETTQKSELDSFAKMK